jgi:cobalt-zinc-cadmium efflux system outer membrane protein
MILAGMCAAAGVPAQTAELTVGDAVRKALEANREFLAARQRLAETKGLLRQAGVRPAPAVEVTGASGRPLGTPGEHEVSIGYVQPVETAGKRGKRLRVARIAVDLAEAELAERTRQITFAVKKRFIEAVAEQGKLEALDNLLRVTRESYRLTEARAQQGDVAPLDAQLLLVELNRAEAQKTAVLGRSRATLVELRSLIGGLDAPALKAALDKAAPGLLLHELEQRALRGRPDLAFARLLESQGAAEVELEEALARPDLTLSAQYSPRWSQLEDPLRRTPAGSPLPLSDRDHVLTFGVSIPWLTRTRNQGNIDAAAARAAAARLRREHLESVIPLEVEAAFRRWESASRALEVFDRGVIEQSEKNLEIIRQAYALGQLRLLDVLNEQRRLTETQMARIETGSEAAGAFAELERAVGGDLQ